LVDLSPLRPRVRPRSPARPPCSYQFRASDHGPTHLRAHDLTSASSGHYLASALQHHAANLPSRFAIREHRRSGSGSPPSSGTGISDATVRYYRPPHQSIPRRRLKIDLAATIQKRCHCLASSPRHPRLPPRAQRRPCQGVPALPPPISSPSRSLLPPSIGLGFDSM
jgi:hypothetical protein